MRIEVRWPCAACQNKRTVRLGDNVEHCFNCGSQWPRVRVRLAFSDSELRRLAVYRRAVRAGFYMDELRVETAAW
jgi:hypothetical protein